ncbi:receptor-type tyrosine-protein phosphatase alpha-like isoform X2 [Octopus sinensis]|uniref:protein-tyrosine-phosphatase n=1 Tax=Octopus sinensis TaxID=2607531 RepID=A0A7E6F596_9MOLL|nr:receptor-type tyrosine-protein phosphatase alpha-like isoform X2 [Octopus sinensis]
MKIASVSMVSLFIFGLFNFISLTHSKNCNKGIDRFGKGKKHQCHCKQLRFCNVTNNGHCNGKGCIFGYEGPNCQKRLYHEFLKSQTGMVMFDVNANNTCRNITGRNQSIQFNHVYRIHQIRLHGRISDTITNIFGSDNQTLECKPTKRVATELLCSGDITTNKIQIMANNSCIDNIKLFGCSPGWFGEECTQECHCQNGSDCHQLTGVCQNGCENGRHGENCQNINYVNVALGRPASQSSTKKKRYIFKGKICRDRKTSMNASSVVDGNNLIFERMCSSTEWEKNPFWKVKLDKNYTISQLRIFTDNLYQLTVYIGNNTKPCFQRPKNHKELSLDVMCREPQIGDSVTIAINAGSAILSLCEVEVLQCLPGFYGNLCHSRCNCQQKECDQITGLCIYDACQAQLAESFLQADSLIVVCVILLVICLVMIYKYCKIKKYTACKKRLSEVTLVSSVPDSIPFDESVYIQPIATELNKQNILIYVQQKKRKLEPFSKDFSDLPCNLLYPCTEAIKPENKDKNRFQCLLPYDHSRVVLQPDATFSSDYINASYIHDKKYISTQVPTKKTMVDFWRMIWQQNCSVIVLLTNNEQPDYVQHLPEVNATLHFGLISVQGVLLMSHKYYTVSKYVIFDPKSKPFVSRTITQYNFTAWPEGMIPAKPEYILNFRQKVNSCSDLKYPIVVQSKTGAGSTGAYICLDILLEKLEQNKALNTAYSIRSLYNERCLIFTKRAQLEFVYDVITESMMTSGCNINFNDLKSEIERISVKDEITCWSIADRQFMDILQPVCQGNSVHSDLLEELYSDERNMSTTNFEISLIEGYEEDKFILAISPDREEMPEFWNIITKEKCLTIVTFRDLTNENTSYLPTAIGQSLNFGQFNLELINFMDKELFQCNVLRVSYTKEESYYYTIVNHYDVTFWKDKTRLPPFETMLSLVNIVSHQNSEKMPIAVHNRCGYFESGLFCAIYSTINMVKAEESCINIARLLRQMKKSQPLILTDPTLYTYCLNVVKASLGNESHYAEVKK